MWLRVSRRSLRRADEARLHAVRDFAGQRGWKVQGLFGDLSSRYPVAPLLGAWSAQAELGIAGQWGECPAFVILVLVLPRLVGPSERRAGHDIVVQLTVLEPGPNPRALTGTKLAVELLPLTAAAREQAMALRKTLNSADRLPADRVVIDGSALVHARVLRPTQPDVDLDGPLRMLVDLATTLAS